MPQTERIIDNTLAIGEILIDEYEIISVLGQGGFGITYKVKDINLNKYMAIKEYMPSSYALRSSKNTITYTQKNEKIFEWGLKRFIEEAKILSNFEHPSIVKAYRVFQANNTAYFVMEYYEGETLEEYLEKSKGKEFTQDEILSIVMPILDGLKEVHKKGFLHRDISPDNIFLRKDKPPVLIDFGASREAIGKKSQTLSSIVKKGYSPPEQYTSNSKQDRTTDIYAICGVIYEMITHYKPPESTHRQTLIFNGDKDLLEDIEVLYKGKYSQSFLKSVKSGLNIRQKDRIQTISELQSGLIKKDTIDTPPQPPNNILKYIAIAMFVIVLAIVAIIYKNRDNSKKEEHSSVTKQQTHKTVETKPTVAKKVSKPIESKKVENSVPVKEKAVKQNQAKTEDSKTKKVEKIQTKETKKVTKSINLNNSKTTENKTEKKELKNSNNCTKRDELLGLCVKKQTKNKCSEHDRVLGLCTN